jgi:hypothetical protein
MATMKDMGISRAYHEPALPPRLATGLLVGTLTLQPSGVNICLVTPNPSRHLMSQCSHWAHAARQLESMRCLKQMRERCMHEFEWCGSALGGLEEAVSAWHHPHKQQPVTDRGRESGCACCRGGPCPCSAIAHRKLRYLCALPLPCTPLLLDYHACTSDAIWGSSCVQYAALPCRVPKIAAIPFLNNCCNA